MRFAIYNLVIVSSIGLLLLCIVWFGLSLEPLDGDLTRIGNFKESEFGYNDPQDTFEANLSDYGDLSEYSRYYDIVVIGDSFADQRERKSGWQNFLVRRTGLSVMTLWHSGRRGGETAGAFLKSEGFRKYPPRILIYESVERGLHTLISRSGYTGACAEQRAVRLPPLHIQQKAVPTVPYRRNVHTLREALPFGVRAKDFEYALHYVSLGLKKSFGGGTSAVELPLSRRDLFSNRKSDHILVLKDDFKKNGLGEADLQSITCGLLNLQRDVESAGTTKLVIMIAPDKTSSYAEFIADRTRQYAGYIPRLPSIDRMPMPRLDVALRTAIAAGVKDVYLPNDTHWGSAGNRLVADTLVDYLLKESW